MRPARQTAQETASCLCRAINDKTRRALGGVWLRRGDGHSKGSCTWVNRLASRMRSSSASREPTHAVSCSESSVATSIRAALAFTWAGHGAVRPWSAQTPGEEVKAVARGTKTPRAQHHGDENAASAETGPVLNALHCDAVVMGSCCWDRHRRVFLRAGFREAAHSASHCG